jgi:hypothetical protein
MTPMFVTAVPGLGHVVRPLAGAMTFRVIARVLQERSFLRTDLRHQLTRAIQRDRPRWRVEDPAQIEVWVSEYAHGRLVAGLRLSDERMRHDGGRVVLLVPQLPRAVVPGSLRLRDRVRIRLLGTATTIWVFDRTAAIPGRPRR